MLETSQTNTFYSQYTVNYNVRGPWRRGVNCYCERIARIGIPLERNTALPHLELDAMSSVATRERRKVDALKFLFASLKTPCKTLSALLRSIVPRALQSGCFQVPYCWTHGHEPRERLVVARIAGHEPRKRLIQVAWYFSREDPSSRAYSYSRVNVASLKATECKPMK